MSNLSFSRPIMYSGFRSSVPAARRPVIATADSPGPGTAADLNPFRRSMGVSQSQRISFSVVVF